MPDLGQFALRLGLFLSAYAILADLLGRWQNRRELLVSGRNATFGSLLCLTVACLALGILLVRSDFAVRYVAENTSRALPLVYKVTALWAGAAGSLLLWLQTGFVALAFSKSDGDTGRFCAAARAAANLVAVFFFLVLIFDKDPFGLSVTTPRDGAGLNPLLQHPAMVLHPPALFLGYAGFVIPYAWTFAALRRQDPSRPPVFLDRTRQWLLLAWIFLSIGIALGAWWAYEELGWGGYWAWDPVENSSLLPWLTATALLHCARTYRTEGKTSLWFMVLAVATFSLCIFGTFLTRYGLVSSVHAFPDPGLGILFLVLLILIWALAGLLFLARSDAVRRFWVPKRDLSRLGSLFGGHAFPRDNMSLRAQRSNLPSHGLRLLRRGAPRHDMSGPNAMDRASESRGVRFVVWNNWLMVLLAFVILVGTLFPFFSGLLSDHKITLKSEYFTKITAPGGLVLLLLLGVCPHLLHHGLSKGWRTVGAVITAIAYFVACAFVGLNLIADFVQRYTGRQGGGTLRAKLRWHGARAVHIGVLMAFIGIAGSSGFDVEKQVALKPGEPVQVGGFELVYNDLNADHGPNFTAVRADVSVLKGQTQLGRLSPSIAFYGQSGKRTSEVDIRRTLAGDLYLALTEADNGSKLINLTIFLKPLINWIWIGTVLMVLGTAMVLAAGFGRRRIAPAEDMGVEP